MKSFLLALAVLLAAPAALPAQDSLPPLERLADRLSRFGRVIPQEKVYVHMDNPSYFLGDTIWFAAYTRRTNEDAPSRISRVLYCELWNHDGYLVERKLVEMKDGRGHGFFALPDTLYSGYFELRAYTRWQLNWGQTEHFHAWSTEYWFYNKAMAKDFFRDYEKLYSRVFPVYDKPRQPGDFYRDMTFRPLRRYFKSEPKAPALRLSLFPEGGNLVAGRPCRVAFEAATSEGEVREGRLQLLRGTEVVASALTEHRGRGTFTFTPQEGQAYEAVFTADAGATAQQDIKAVAAEGVALQVRRDSLSGDWLFALAAAGHAARQPLGLTVMHEGRLEDFRELDLSADSACLRFAAPASPGIRQVTVFDSVGHIYADRLFFLTSPELARPTLAVSGAREQYAPFEPIDLDVASAHPDSGQVVSLSVRDAVHADHTFDSGTILTEMLLASEIKGFVPQPEFFFERDDAEHRRALDLLMMTQGWRRFNWQEMAVSGTWELTHPAEHTQIVSGTVNRFWDVSSGENIYDQVMADHEHFMTELNPSSSQQNGSLLDADGSPQAQTFLKGTRFRNMAWNLNPIYERRSQIGAISDTRHGVFSLDGRSWLNTDYDVLSFSTGDSYRDRRRRQQELAARRYVETGTVKKEVRVHAEFVNPYVKGDCLVGDAETRHGRFHIDLPRFEGECLFYLGASDTTKWHKKWDGLRRRKPHVWVAVDDYTEYDAMAGRLPDYPEYYVRLNFPYPRWIKPYTFYQVHNAPLRDTTSLSPRLLTDGTNLLEQITVRASHGGLRRIDFSKPAYVIDAYEALNLALDAGIITPTQSSEAAASGAAMALISDMAMHRHWEMKIYNDQRASGFNWSPLQRKRNGMLTYADKFYIYTDYSPRREGDERYEQSNQPVVAIDIRPLPDSGMRATYRDRRYFLHGFAYQEDFYHPDYERTPPAEGQKDYRRTLYWNPELQLDADGRAHVRLFNNSQQTTIAIDAAGQTAAGGLLFSR